MKAYLFLLQSKNGAFWTSPPNQLLQWSTLWVWAVSQGWKQSRSVAALTSTFQLAWWWRCQSDTPSLLWEPRHPGPTVDSAALALVLCASAGGGSVGLWGCVGLWVGGAVCGAARVQSHPGRFLLPLSEQHGNWSECPVLQFTATTALVRSGRPDVVVLQQEFSRTTAQKVSGIKNLNSSPG